MRCDSGVVGTGGEHSDEGANAEMNVEDEMNVNDEMTLTEKIGRASVESDKMSGEAVTPILEHDAEDGCERTEE